MFVVLCSYNSVLREKTKKLCPFRKLTCQKCLLHNCYMKKKNTTTGKRGFVPNREEYNKNLHHDARKVQETVDQLETETSIEETLRKFGVLKKPHVSKEGDERLEPYDKLVSRFGEATLRSFESGLLWSSTLLVIILVFSGIILSVDAFLHTNFERETPKDVIAATSLFVDEATRNVVQPLFTPLILLFFVSSISLGVLKTLQLTSSKTVYRE
jgi:hypothetical protein